ncbi:MAG: folate family ECF transporter S component [Oscillospiraceae bacterium]|nr:folate family ECF transporter S component [Oscillospiraceae bacterium]
MSALKKLLKNSYRELKNPRSLTSASLLTAIYIVSYYPAIGRFIIVPGIVEIRLGFIAIAVAAALFGPFMAAIVAFLGDLIGALLLSGVSFFWGFTVSFMLLGFVFGLCFYKKKITLSRIVCAQLFNTCVISLLLTTKWLQIISGSSFQELFLLRLPLSAVMLPINIILLYFSLRAVCAAYDRVIAGYR